MADYEVLSESTIDEVRRYPDGEVRVHWKANPGRPLPPAVADAGSPVLRPMLAGFAGAALLELIRLIGG